MQSETGFPSSHQLKSYVAYKSRLKLAARAVLSADAGLLVVHIYAQNVTVSMIARISSVLKLSLQQGITFLCDAGIPADMIYLRPSDHKCISLID